MSNQIECPVDLVPVNQNKIRVIAFLVLCLALSYWFSRQTVILTLLAADFGLRAFNLQRYSPLANVADMLVRQMGLKNHPTDQAPKRFAARLGFGISVLLVVLKYFYDGILLDVVLAMLVFFAFLESVLGICVGCHIYTLTQRIKSGFAKQG